MQASNPTRYEGFSGSVIGGLNVPGGTGRFLADTDPYDGAELANIGLADAGDLDRAFRTAKAAQGTWAATSPATRSALFTRTIEIMDRRRDEIVDWIIRETGGTRTKATVEWATTRATMLEAVGMPGRAAGRILPGDVPGKENRIYRKPLGVVGVISPWNMPMHLSGRSVAPALALGNAVVVKPADETPVTGGLLLARIYEEAGLPPGLLNVVIGDVKDIGDAFTLHPVPRFISFTGSTRVGRHIGSLAVTGPTIKKVALELGGNSPCVVLDDADIDLAVRVAAFGRFMHQGQICMSSNRIIVADAIFDTFAERFVAHVATFKAGDPKDPDTVIGPVISRRQLDGMLARIEEARAAGVDLRLGGSPQGLVLPPHVFVDVDNSSPLAQSELFGPIATIIRARDDAHALTLANATEYGLSSAVFSRDAQRALRFAQGVEAGMTHINDATINDLPHIMFGGEKNSGLGRFNGDWIIDELTTDHWISVQHEPRSYPF